TLLKVSLVSTTPLNPQLVTVKPLTFALGSPLTLNTLGTWMDEQWLRLNGPHTGGELPVCALFVEGGETEKRVRAPGGRSGVMFVAPPPRWVFDLTYRANFVTPMMLHL